MLLLTGLNMRPLICERSRSVDRAHEIIHRHIHTDILKVISEYLDIA